MVIRPKTPKFLGDSMLLAYLEREYPNVFSDPSYPIAANRTPFMILLTNLSLHPSVGNCILKAIWNWMS